MARKLCLITGASSGIGREYASLMAQYGYDLALVARREKRLLEIATEIENKWGANCIIINQDLAQNGAVDNILNIINEKGYNVDCLINNAGYGLGGTFFSTNWQDQKDFIQVLFVVPSELCHKVINGMKERNFGRIINVASVAGFLPGAAGHTLYGAVKSSLIKLTQSLKHEVKGYDIKVTALCPGLTYSEFHDVNQTRGTLDKLPKFMWQNAHEVAKAGFIGMENNKTVVITGAINKFAVFLTRIMPDNVLDFFIEKNNDKFRKLDK